MIDAAHLAALSPAQRADLIYRHAQAELAQGLWRAALGEQEEQDGALSGANLRIEGPSGLNALLAMVNDGSAGSGGGVGEPACGTVQPAAPTPAPAQAAPVRPASLERLEALGPNERFADAITRAAERTGLPASALASILDAEAARGKDGAWNVHSRNPRSSAAGLGQFLSGTWESEAERPGTWLNDEAGRRGWLNATGEVIGSARSSLLALRYDAEASIQATADYARGNLMRLERAGVRVEDGSGSIARAAYLGHHLGPGDAAKFLTGGLDATRARRLLNAQVGQPAAARRIAEAGNAADAHRQWLNSYVDRRIQPDRFTRKL